MPNTEAIHGAMRRSVHRTRGGSSAVVFAPLALSFAASVAEAGVAFSGCVSLAVRRGRRLLGRVEAPSRGSQMRAMARAMRTKIGVACTGPKIHQAPRAEETREPTITDRLIAPENADVPRTREASSGVTSATRAWPVGGIAATAAPKKGPRAAMMAPAARKAPM